MSRYFLIFSLLMVSACNNFENRGVDFEDAKNSPLLIPPCADNTAVSEQNGSQIKTVNQ